VANLNNSIKTEAYKLVFWQHVIVVGLALIVFLLQGLQSGLSALLGGLAYGLPNVMFVWRVFARTSAQAAKQFLFAFVVGEATKLLMSAVLFVLIVKFLPVKLLSVLAGYIAAIIAFWIVSFVLMSHEQPGEGQ
jgi:ATP synthase protein I